MQPTLTSIDSAIESLDAARLDWATNGSVYMALGIARRSLLHTRKRAIAQLRKANAENHAKTVDAIFDTLAK